jgi:hypothetical protein
LLLSLLFEEANQPIFPILIKIGAWIPRKRFTLLFQCPLMECIVEEDIPPHWEEIHNHLQNTGGEHMTQEIIEIHLNYQELVMIGCLVEEELHHMMSYYCNKSVDPNVKDPGIKWGEFWNEDESRDPPNKDLHTKMPMQPALDNHDPPKSCSLTEEHLALIFEMRRDLAK